MQFYIVHKDPETNAEQLPDYALKRVNIREGWQIISDIGHRFDVTFEGQFKAYNPYHPLTRTLSHKEAFGAFIGHYRACCDEYIKRFCKETVHITCFRENFSLMWLIKEFLPENQYEETRHYLITRKAKHLTEKEKKGGYKNEM